MMPRSRSRQRQAAKIAWMDGVDRRHGSEALALLDQTSFDLVIAAWLCRHERPRPSARHHGPPSAHRRVLLSGSPAAEFILNAVGIVHQLLVKPCRQRRSARDGLPAAGCWRRDPDGRGPPSPRRWTSIHGRGPLVVQSRRILHPCRFISSNRIDRWEERRRTSVRADVFNGDATPSSRFSRSRRDEGVASPTHRLSPAR